MDNGVILQLAGTFASVTIAYFLGRKKNRAEVRKLEAAATVNELEATEKAVAIWRGLAEELRSEVEQLRELVNELRDEIDELKAQNASLLAEMHIYKTKENG